MINGIDFVFTDYLESVRDKKITFEGNLDEIRGLAVPVYNVIYVHLGAEQWRSMIGKGEDYLITCISNTIIHECGHLLIDKILEPLEAKGEEKVCEILAGQC